MIRNKKGLSNVVTVVLIILLGLAAVGIIWAFIQPTINRAGSSIDLGAECLEVDARPTGCELSCSGGTCDVDSLNVQLTRGDTTLVSGLVGTIESDTGEVIAAESTGTVQLLSTKSIDFGAQTIDGTSFTARVSVMLVDGDESTTCSESVTVIDCTINPGS